MQLVQDTHHSLFRVWELGVSFLGPLSCQYSRAANIHVANFPRNKEQMIAPMKSDISDSR
jgi:hypothetical protein